MSLSHGYILIKSLFLQVFYGRYTYSRIGTIMGTTPFGAKYFYA